MASLFGLVAVLALAVTPAFAKEGAVARLDTAVHRDAQPGSTIEVRWSVVQIAADKEHPLSGTPFVVTLTGPDGSSNEATGVETPSGTGHYVTSVVVPRGGIQDLSVALRGEACYDGGGCSRVDYTFPLTDDRLVTGTPVGLSAPAPASTTTSAPGWVSNALVPLVAIGVGFALAGGIAALIVARRRQVAIDPTGR